MIQDRRDEGTRIVVAAGRGGTLGGMRIAVPLDKAHRLLNHGPVALVSTAHGGRRNVMAAAWVMPIDFEPPKLAAVIAADTLTRELLVASGECVLQAPLADQAALTYAVGTCSGRDGDKFARFGLAAELGARVGAPLLAGCAAWLECRRLPEPDIEGRYDLFVLECVAAWADDRLWRDGSWRFQDGGPATIHHEKGGSFFVTGRTVSGRQAIAP